MLIHRRYRSHPVLAGLLALGAFSSAHRVGERVALAEPQPDSAAEQRQWNLVQEITRAAPPRHAVPAFVDAAGPQGSGPQARIQQHNDVGFGFKVVKASYWLDDRPLSTRTDSSGLKNATIFSGRVYPGRYRLRLRVEIRGESYGLFSYMNGYRIGLSTTKTIEFAANRSTEVDVKVVSANAGGPLSRRFRLDVVVR